MGNLEAAAAQPAYLIAFLTARLAEDEAAANEVHRPRDCGAVDRDGEFDPDPIWCSCHYPARALRDVAAKRVILARYAEPLEGWGLGEQLQLSQEKQGLYFAVLALAAVWSEHPDYRTEWKALTAVSAPRTPGRSRPAPSRP